MKAMSVRNTATENTPRAAAAQACSVRPFSGRATSV